VQVRCDEASEELSDDMMPSEAKKLLLCFVAANKAILQPDKMFRASE
jgi:hypothetical protein